MLVTAGVSGMALVAPLVARADGGWERGCLGYPISDEFAITGGRQSNFQRRMITFDAASLQTTAKCGG